MNSESIFQADHLPQTQRSSSNFSRDTDKKAPGSNTTPMNDITREELDAKLQVHDLKVEARLKDFENKVADGITQVNHSLQLLDKDLSAFRGIKATIILNSVISVIAIVGIVIGVMAYGVSSFDSGRDTAAIVQELKQQNSETRQLLEQIKAQQPSSAKP